VLTGKKAQVAVIMVIALSCPWRGAAQVLPDPKRSFAWTENIGWSNWYPDPNVLPVVHANYLEGWIWTENAGWLNLGNGNGPYANLSDQDFGVNLDPNSGELTGFAWGENVGWINFGGGRAASPPNPARLGSDCRLHGFAWGENVGWINLDDPDRFVGFILLGDLTSDGRVAFADLTVVLQNFQGSGVPAPGGDVDGDGDTDLDDLIVVLLYFGSTCR